ncbi:hypothetical protein J2S40_004378 [Nocardioides luteus]|uniref:Type VII secretion integral membrane protein EccD n=1 Tax=Nocardioides luteus TaxID=1844 RepID=A0ABQ5SQF7_9ACTN|nr:EsaB/YukD family protein [Nocardioides luteus]MDR7313320.1 hypothetical protein [Nocardioides luteus]GLJ66385.1 hypothetical protein GCM10017579_04210 [Nocardioides luteus]
MPTQTADAVEPALAAGGLAVTVHGTAGVVDIVVPSDAHASDLAREYATAVGLPAAPVLRDRRGEIVPPDASLASRGITTGALLAADSPPTQAYTRREAAETPAPEPVTAGNFSFYWVGLATLLAVAAAGLGVYAEGWHQLTIAAVLGVGALIGLVPTGPYAARRAIVAPAFAAGAGFVITVQPVAETLPMAVGVAGLTGAIVATIARSLVDTADAALKIWTIAGVAVFVVTALCALFGTSPQVPWSILFAAAALAARIVPSYAVDVPDSYLLDVSKLSVTAWSARAKTASGKTTVPIDEVTHVADRGARTLAAASWAVLAVVVASGPALVATATANVDRVGGWVITLAGAFVILLSARSYRYWLPRGVLRVAGIIALAVGVRAFVGWAAPELVSWFGVGVVVIGFAVIIAAIATGRGWRSAKWAARADWAESLCGAIVIASFVVSSGFFRHLWESGFSS